MSSAAAPPQFVTIPIDIAIEKFKSKQVSYYHSIPKKIGTASYIALVYKNVQNHVLNNGKYEPKGAVKAEARAYIVFDDPSNRINISAGPVDFADNNNPLWSYDNKQTSANITVRINESGKVGELMKLAHDFWVNEAGAAIASKMKSANNICNFVRYTYSEKVQQADLRGLKKDDPDFTLKFQFPSFNQETRALGKDTQEKLTKQMARGFKTIEAEDLFRKKYLNTFGTIIRKADKTYFDDQTKSPEYYSMIIDAKSEPKQRFPYRNNIHKVISRGSKIVRAIFVFEASSSNFGLALQAKLNDIVLDNSEMRTGGYGRQAKFDESDLLVGEPTPAAEEKVQAKALTPAEDEDDDNEDEDIDDEPVVKKPAKAVAKPIKKAPAKVTKKKVVVEPENLDSDDE